MLHMRNLSTVDPGVYLLIFPSLHGLETSNLLEHQFKSCSWPYRTLLHLFVCTLSNMLVTIRLNYPFMYPS